MNILGVGVEFELIGRRTAVGGAYAVGRLGLSDINASIRSACGANGVRAR